VNNAHMFGLADLHQLRGRVGRFDRPAYAYFMVPRHETLETDAKKRLAAIQEYTQLGAGFKIAMQDLEIRGAGNLLGTQQHGYISAVGFDLYCRLLKEAVGNLGRVMANEKKQN
jgi:transcription-repair coupling factor (superfamily II helicase)